MTEDGTVTVRIGTDHYKSVITTDSHSLKADEPASLGGSDTGPTPYDLLLASLGSCTAITMRMYADRKRWPLESVEVVLSQERQHAQDCEDCESESGMILRITKRIDMRGDLTEEQRLRLLEVADRCPVHKSLLGEIRIDSSS